MLPFERRLMPRSSSGRSLVSNCMRNRGNIKAIWIFISSIAKYSPMQRRGPSENGMNAA